MGKWDISVEEIDQMSRDGVDVEEAFQQLENRLYDRNNRLIDKLSEIMGKDWRTDYDMIIDDLDFIRYMKLSKNHSGKLNEDNLSTIKESWNTCRSNGMHGDSFTGEIWLKLKENLYLEFGYDC